MHIHIYLKEAATYAWQTDKFLQKCYITTNKYNKGSKAY